MSTLQSGVAIEPASDPGAVAEREPSGRRAWIITAVLGVVYLILAPSPADLAAAEYRSYLFAHSGFSLSLIHISEPTRPY